MEFERLKTDRTRHKAICIKRRDGLIAKLLMLSSDSEEFLDTDIEIFWLQEEIDRIEFTEQMEQRKIGNADDLNDKNYDFASHLAIKKAKYEKIINSFKQKVVFLNERLAKETDIIKQTDIEEEIRHYENNIYSKERFLREYLKRNEKL